MEFRLLGPVECAVDGERITLGRPQQRCLLAVLLLDLGRVVSVNRLVELLWDGEPPVRARSIVHTHIARLRSALRAAGAPGYGVRLLTRGQGYVMEADPETVDVHRFRRLVADSREAHEPAIRAGILRDALALWRGSALADAATARVREQICAGLDELQLSAIEDRVEADLALGRHRDAVTEMTGMVARHPLRERTVALLILALYRSGQQARALETYRTTRRALIEELGIEPGAELRRLEQAILTQDPSVERAGPAPVEPAPPRTAPTWHGPRSHLTSIVGRDRQLAELTGLLADHRLVTVVGTGGVGKTTLALHAAEAVAAHRSVAVVTLAPARDAEDIALELGAVVGVAGACLAEVWEELERYVARQPRLLVLDNCEHLIPQCTAVIRRLLSASAHLRVLATSRQSLGLPEETVWRLEPLRVPDDDRTAVREVPAVALFLRRARDAVPGFEPSDSDLTAVARICCRVEGLPLALELAAGRLRGLPATQVADQLEQGFGLLSAAHPGAPGRHTMATAVEWSFRLLRNEEQRLFAGLSVFRAGFTAQDAAQVCGVTVQEVVALADKSLIQAYESGNGTRYRLLEVVREYAGERLDGCGDRAATTHRYFDHWLARCREVLDRPDIDEQFAGWAELAPDLDNLRAAVEYGYACGRHVDTVELTLSMVDCLAAHNAYAEQERWLDRAWPYLPQCPPRLRCFAQWSRALLLTLRDDPLGALAHTRPAVADLAVHHPLAYLDARISNVRNEVRVLDPAALRTGGELHQRLRRAQDRHIRLHSLVMAAEVLIIWGRYDQATAVCRRDEPTGPDLDPASSSRYYAARCLAELGAGHVDAAATLANRLRERLARPGHVHLSTPARALALWALTTQTPGVARHLIGNLLRLLTDRYPPTISRAYALALLLSEAERRHGDLLAARVRLAEALHVGRTGTDYSRTMPAVLTAAALAAQLGDEAASQDLAGRWDRIRLATGLPAPLGFTEPVADLGLDPAPPPEPQPGHVWREQPLRDLVADAHAWCTAGNLSSGPAAIAYDPLGKG